MEKFYSGFVTIIGRPNVGKSTLINHYIGEKVSIVTSKPQTTRNKIRAILTGEDYQIVFIDTPGLHEPTSKLGRFMVKSAEGAIKESDAVVYIIEPKLYKKAILEQDMAIIRSIKYLKQDVFLVINKIDTVNKIELLEIIDLYNKEYEFKEIIPISAIKGDNTQALLENLRKILPEGPAYFPDDMITDQPERQIAAEIIREKALTFLQDEIPHGLAVEINSMKQREPDNTDSIVDISATIYCERENHKSIVIGKQGDMLKRIGTAARKDIENLLGSKIFLETWVRAKKNWRDSDFLLKNFGYKES